MFSVVWCCLKYKDLNIYEVKKNVLNFWIFDFWYKMSFFKGLFSCIVVYLCIFLYVFCGKNVMYL